MFFSGFVECEIDGFAGGCTTGFPGFSDGVSVYDWVSDTSNIFPVSTTRPCLVSLVKF